MEDEGERPYNGARRRSEEPLNMRRSNGDPARQPPSWRDVHDEGEPLNLRRNNGDPARQTPIQRGTQDEGEPLNLRHSNGDPARQIPGQRDTQDEGAEGSFNTRQVRKRPSKSISREPTTANSRTAPSRRHTSRQRETPRRGQRHRSCSWSSVSLSDDASEVRGRRRRRHSMSNDNDSDDSPLRRLKNRRRSRTPSRRSHRDLSRENLNVDTNTLNKFLDILANVRQSTSKLSLTNVVPEFDPMAKDQTVITWLTKVEECAEIYKWDERETIHFALPKLTGFAKQWYQGLNSVLHSWTEWKRKLIESFPCRQDYADLLVDMLAKRARYGESLEQYYYAKINLLNRCGISGRNAVDCLLHGVDDRAVRVGAQAARFRTPEEALKYFKTVKSTSNREVGDKYVRDKKSTGANNDRTRTDVTKRTSTTSVLIKCHNCNEEGHKSFKCRKPLSRCTNCSRTGHLETYCRTKPSNNAQNQNNSNNATRDEKQVAMLDRGGESNLKYIIEIEINSIPITCQVDLGSQCTLIKKTEAQRLGLNMVTSALPSLRGIGGHCIQPVGRCHAEVTVQGIKENVEIIVVEDIALKYPVLLGHSFTEKPHLTMVKTPNQIIFEKDNDHKLYLMIRNDIAVPSNQLTAIPVESVSTYTGPIYVNGTIRGTVGNEHYLLPGEYILAQGVGHLLVQNISNKSISFKKGALLTRAIPVATVSERNVCSVSLDGDSFDDKVQCGSQVTAEERQQLHDLLSKFTDCFSSSLKDIGFTTAGEMVIELDDTEPVVYRPYRMSYGERTLVNDMVQEMVDAGIVTESSSPYASPIVLVKKKTGEKRLCVDYRALNRRTKKDHYPLPLIDDQLDRLAGNSLFISLDLASGYYQIPIEPTSQDKTAFITPDGQYQFTRMPFGLVNAPSVFQRTINKILAEAKVKYALVYMDDILIPARSFEEGLGRLEEVLSLLRQGGLTLKLSKCHFFMTKLEFLGFEINADGIKPGQKKTEAVSKFPPPKNQRELQQFIGLASFFRRFVQGFATIARPLTDLLKKGTDWKWGPEQDEAFEAIKSRLIQRPLLALYDPKRETQVHTDASKFGLGGILLQKDDAGMLRPVSYYSKKTTSDERKFHSFELETLAVVSALSRFRVYLLGIPFKIVTDCNALRTTLSKRDLIPRIARWWVQLQEFDCVIEYRPGTKMLHADALSRNPVGEAGEDLHVLDVFVVGTEDWITTVQNNDEEIIRIKEILGDSGSEKIKDIVNNYKMKNGRVYRIIGKEESDIRWVVPRGVRWQIAKMNHDDLGHFGFDKTLTRIRQTYWFPKMRKFVKKYVNSCLECARNKDPTGKQPGELHPIPKPEIPFHTVHADHLGPFVRSKRGNCYLLVLVDGFTKYVNIKPVRDTKTSTSIRALKEHISCFGTPTRLITDRGTSFTSNHFHTFMETLNIKHILNAVATPRANGQCERYNRTILSALSTKANDKDDKNWDEYIYDIQIGLNTTVQKTTGKTPSELLFGFNINSGSENVLREVLDDTREVVIDNIQEIRNQAGMRISHQQIKDKARFDSKRKTAKIYSENDLVSVRREVPSDGKSRKLAVKFQGPYRIVKVLPNDRFLIEDTPLTRKRGHRRYENVVAVDKLKPWLVFNRDLETTDSESGEQSDSEKMST